jgi:tetratricopeptide (TPR) repeat protein
MKAQYLPQPTSSHRCSVAQDFGAVVAAQSAAKKLQQLRQRAKQAIATQHYQQAIVYLSQVIQQAPYSALDYNNRGLIFFYLGQLRKALQDYETAIALDPTLDSPYNNRANCLVSLNRPAEAIADYEQALDLNPANLKTWLNLGITLRELGQYDGAIENFDIALIIGNGLQGRLYAERGYTYYLRGDWNCAIADYRRAIAHLTLEDSYYHKVHALLDRLIHPTPSESV